MAKALPSLTYCFLTAFCLRWHDGKLFRRRQSSFQIVVRKTSVVIGSGKVTAIDGTVASKGLAKAIIKMLTPEEHDPKK